MAAAGLRPEYEVKPNEICFENLESDGFPFAETSS